MDADARSALLALVRDNPHPVSRALHEAVLALGPVEAAGGTVAETVGAGVRLGPWTLGRPGWADTGGAAGPDAGTVLARDGRVVAVFDLVDTPRPGAAEEIAALRENGAVDQLEIARLKKRKLLLKDEIQVLTDRIIPDIIA